MQHLLVFLFGIAVLSFLTISAHSQPVTNETSTEISKATCLQYDTYSTMCTALCTSCVVNDNSQNCNSCATQCSAFDNMCSAACSSCTNTGGANSQACDRCFKCND
jgi:hypothetical protein